MDREPRTRRRTWFTKPRPNTVGQTFQQGQQAEQKSDAWLTREEPPAREKTSQRMDWQPLPPLPKWPPLPGEPPLPPDRVHGAASFTPPSALDAEQPTTAWDKSAFDLPTHDEYDFPEQPPNTLWSRFRSASRRMQVGIATGIACVFVLCTFLGVATLNLAFHPSASHLGPTGGSTSLIGNGTASPSASLATPSISGTASPAAATATSVPPFTIAFTCASGVIGGTGEVCVHTQPNAILTLRVQYCDGSFAGGKSVQGTAHADGSGDHTWRWTVTTNCAGSATATVTAKSSGQITTQSTTFTITR